MFDTKEIQKGKKKKKIPRFASAHPERTGLANGQQRNTRTDTKRLWKKKFREQFQKKKFLFPLFTTELFTVSPQILSSGCARQ